MPSGKGTYGTKKGRPPKRKPKWQKSLGYMLTFIKNVKE
jgi:hypothetical protein